jgi:hypothetical protein
LEFMIVAASLIHDHTEMQKLVHRGSTRPRRGNAVHNLEVGHYRLQRDNFHPTKPVLTENLFPHRFRILRDLFLTIIRGIRNYGCVW